MSEHIGMVTDDNFEEDVLKSDLPVLVDFWAEWCGPCRAIAPVLVTIAEEYSGKLKVVKLNTDENTETAAQYGIRSIPTLMLFKNGNMAATRSGLLNKSQMIEYIDENI